ncbi:hypothetical protein [Streptomyces sp. bgisy032]|uniref:hypothetical protein n=1 Tax=Streptomyces sp. bgisy032 TaxID=3413773 RepID=UPI003D754C54
MRNASTRCRSGFGARRSLRGALVLAVAGAVSALVSGCSDGSGAQESEVASVDSGKRGGSRSSAAAEAEAGRPQLRLDTTIEEEVRMYQGYLRCLKDQGVDIPRSGGKGGEDIDPNSLWFPGVNVAEEHPAAERKCLSKRPLPPSETDPKKNPNYMADYREWIECNNRRGLAVDPLPDGSGWNYREGGNIPDNADRIDSECRIEAFSEQ